MNNLGLSKCDVNCIIKTTTNQSSIANLTQQCRFIDKKVHPDSLFPTTVTTSCVIVGKEQIFYLLHYVFGSVRINIVQVFGYVHSLWHEQCAAGTSDSPVLVLSTW